MTIEAYIVQVRPLGVDGQPLCQEWMSIGKLYLSRSEADIDADHSKYPFSMLDCGKESRVLTVKLEATL